MILYGSVGILILLILCNLSLKLTIEGTADQKQGTVALTGQYLFLHFHKTIAYPWDQSRETDKKNHWLPALHLLHLSKKQQRGAFERIGQSFLRGVHFQQFTIHGGLSLSIYPYAAIGYGIICGLLGALSSRQKHQLPLKLEIAPAEQSSFFYMKSIIILTPAHIMVICLRILKNLAVQAAKQSLENKRRRAAYHERASY